MSEIFPLRDSFAVDISNQLCETETKHSTRKNRTRLSRKRIKRPKIKKGFTTILFLPTIAALSVLFAGYSFGIIPWWLLCVSSLPFYWYCYMTSHDAIHRAAHKNPTVNRLVGWISTGLFGLPFSMMRRAHLSHHAREGKPDDIEQFAYRSSWRFPLGVLFGNWFFYTSLPKCKRSEKLTAIAMITAVIVLLVYFSKTAVFGWLLPMQIVFALGMFTNIYLPHGRFADWVDRNIPFVTGFHQTHHAMPGYPWHQICQRQVRLFYDESRKVESN